MANGGGLGGERPTIVTSCKLLCVVYGQLPIVFAISHRINLALLPTLYPAMLLTNAIRRKHIDMHYRMGQRKYSFTFHRGWTSGNRPVGRDAIGKCLPKHNTPPTTTRQRLPRQLLIPILFHIHSLALNARFDFSQKDRSGHV